MLLFSLGTMLFTYAILRLQAVLPLQALLNPQKISAISEHLAFNTAASFVTNTNWQSYGGESTMSYLSQMVALAIHNFLSAAVGHRCRGGRWFAESRGTGPRRWAIFGSMWCESPSTICPCRSALWSRSSLCIAGHDPEFQTVRFRQH